MILVSLFMLIYIVYFFKYELGNKFINLLIWIILLIICIIRNETNVYDYSGYKDIYDTILADKYVLIEPSFNLIVKISSFLMGGAGLLFLIYALLSLIPKFFLFNKLSFNPIHCSIIYPANFFILHDLTQTRSVVFFLFSIYIFDKINILKFGILNLFGYFFHYSYFIYTLVFFIRNIKISKYFYVFLILLGYIFFLFKISLFDFLLTSQSNFSLTEKANQYITLLDNTTVNLFNPVFLIRIFIFLFFLFNVKKYIYISKFSKLFLNYYFFGIIIYLFLWKFPAFAGRFSEMFFLLEIFIIPLIFYEFKNLFLKDFIIYLYSFVFLILYIFYFKILIL